MPLATSAASATRVLAIDVARFVALAGMFAAHTWNRTPDGQHTLVGEIVAGRAAALFAVLAGMGVVFVTRRALQEGRRGTAARLLVGRGLAILAIGLTLGLLDVNIYIVLAYYGLLFVALAPLAGLKTQWLLVIAAVLALIGPVINVQVRESLGVLDELGSPTWADLLEPITLLRGLLITGIYPVITWLVYAMLGIVLARALLAAPDAKAVRRLGAIVAAAGTAGVIIGAGASAVVLQLLGGAAELAQDYGRDGPRIVDQLLADSGTGSPPTGDPLFLAASAPHTGTLPDLLITAGIAAVVIGLLLVLLPAPGRRTRLALIPLSGAGAAPLTVYSVHVTLTAVVPAVVALASGRLFAPFEYSSSPQLYLANLAVALVLGTALTLLKTRGPLETAVRAAGRAVAGTLRTGGRS